MLSTTAYSSLGSAKDLRDHLEHALARIAQSARHFAQLSDIRMQAGGEFASARAVDHVARRRDAQCPRFHRFLHKCPHLRHVFRRGGFTGQCPRAHHIDAHGGVRQLGGNIHVKISRFQPVEIVGECLPIPGQTFGQHDFGNILHPFHQLHQHIALIRLAGCEADPAIAHHNRCDAVDR
jgi:hypothetical protein